MSEEGKLLRSFKKNVLSLFCSLSNTNQIIIIFFFSSRCIKPFRKQKSNGGICSTKNNNVKAKNVHRECRGEIMPTRLK